MTVTTVQAQANRFRFVAYLMVGMTSLIMGVLYRIWELWFMLVYIPSKRILTVRGGSSTAGGNLQIGSYNLPLEYVLIGFGILIIGWPIFRTLRKQGF